MLMFENREAWQAHELEQHRRLWTCQICGFQTTEGERHLSSHLNNTHDLAINTGQFRLLLSISSQPLREIDATSCPLCDWDASLRAANPDFTRDSPITIPVDRFFRHVGQHLEQLALFAVPRPLPKSNDAASVKSRHAHGGSTRSRQLVEVCEGI